jgi:transcriptional regulator with XRE-family HTH domain
MIVKRLRTKNGWSQDQLATLTGLSLRTIQRVEAGRAASMETINSLSSVFETDITKFTEEIEVIDKDAESWKEVPLWVRAGVWGIRKRSAILKWEISCLVFGFVGLIGTRFDPSFAYLFIFWGAAYWYAVSIRWIDNSKLWL